MLKIRLELIFLISLCFVFSNFVFAKKTKLKVLSSSQFLSKTQFLKLHEYDQKFILSHLSKNWIELEKKLFRLNGYNYSGVDYLLNQFLPEANAANRWKGDKCYVGGVERAPINDLCSTRSRKCEGASTEDSFECGEVYAKVCVSRRPISSLSKRCEKSFFEYYDHPDNKNKKHELWASYTRYEGLLKSACNADAEFKVSDPCHRPISANGAMKKYYETKLAESAQDKKPKKISQKGSIEIDLTRSCQRFTENARSSTTSLSNEKNRTQKTNRCEFVISGNYNTEEIKASCEDVYNGKFKMIKLKKSSKRQRAQQIKNTEKQIQTKKNILTKLTKEFSSQPGEISNRASLMGRRGEINGLLVAARAKRNTKYNIVGIQSSRKFREDKITTLKKQSTELDVKLVNDRETLKSFVEREVKIKHTLNHIDVLKKEIDKLSFKINKKNRPTSLLQKRLGLKQQLTEARGQMDASDRYNVSQKVKDAQEVIELKLAQKLSINNKLKKEQNALKQLNKDLENVANAKGREQNLALIDKLSKQRKKLDMELKRLKPTHKDQIQVIALEALNIELKQLSSQLKALQTMSVGNMEKSAKISCEFSCAKELKKLQGDNSVCEGVTPIQAPGTEKSQCFFKSQKCNSKKEGIACGSASQPIWSLNVCINEALKRLSQEDKSRSSSRAN